MAVRDRGAVRFTALDGLRGLAALVVVVHHSLLVSPQFAAAYGGPANVRVGGAAWWLTHTPLHLVWDGPEAVLVFFVLSGFVLAQPFLGGVRPSWIGYYPRRIVRLYAPVLGAVLFALLTFLAVPHTAASGLSWWTSAHDVPITAKSVLRVIALIFGIDRLWYDSPLWSLQWEVLFSLLLPLYVVAARKVPRRWGIPAGVLLIVVMVAGSKLWNGFWYLPVFALGVLLAVHRTAVVEMANRVPRWLWPALTVVAVLLITSSGSGLAVPGAYVLPVLGAVLVVVLFLVEAHAVRLGNRRAVQWLGKRSFSLYLVHEPIVVTAAFVLHTETAPLVLAIALPVSLLTAELFYRLVERPSHRLANMVGRRVAAGRAASAPRKVWKLRARL